MLLYQDSRWPCHDERLFHTFIKTTCWRKPSKVCLLFRSVPNVFFSSLQELLLGLPDSGLPVF